MTDPTPRDRALAGEVVKVTDERLAEMQRIAIASEGVEVYSLHWHWVAAINELIEARKEVEELRAEVERLTKERAAYRSLAGIGFSGTDEADELAALPPLVRDQEAFRRKQGRQSGLIGSAPHCPTCGCGASEPNTPGPQS